MCDGVTQGQRGMELSLFSRDVIALAAGVALSHNTFDAAVYLGVCDKIVPGLIIAAATFGYLPGIFFFTCGANGIWITKRRKGRSQTKICCLKGGSGHFNEG
jgi:dihydroxyacid dehydratase/phosphogluconate dehydratase